MRISDWSSDVCSSDLDNPQSTLKLAHARGVVLLGCARGGLTVAEYAPRLVKKAIVGTGSAAKAQVQAMLRVLLPGAKVASADAADALAVSICHPNHRPNIYEIRAKARRRKRRNYHKNTDKR